MNSKLKYGPKQIVARIAAFILLLVCSASTLLAAQGGTFRNPVMPGFNPDPSVCRVGDDYYMTTSSFTWYPGLPVYHSRDLVHWELISHGISRLGLLDMNGLNDNDGTWAATIRHHNGVFYIITTASKCGGNFYITATDPRGPWSDPVWLKDAPGIDPSLFFDDDGRCYYTGNVWDFKKSWPGQCGVWIQELNLKKRQLTGERKIISYGHASNAKYAEGPHIYKVDGRYMLIMAEGGSGSNHAVTVMHSDKILGSYVADMVNPVLTHRHLGRDYHVTNIGHADLVQTQSGQWYAVALGNRLTDGLSTLGRETFLCRVDFENGTPIFNRGYGRVLDEQAAPALAPFETKAVPTRFEFGGVTLKPGWYTVRTPRTSYYSLSGGALNLSLRPETVDSLVHSSMLLRKPDALSFTATTKISFSTRHSYEHAGLILYRTANGYYALLKGKDNLTLVRKSSGKKSIVATETFHGADVYLKTDVSGATVNFSFSRDGSPWSNIGGSLSMTPVADDNKFNKFNGLGVGLYATSNGRGTKTSARFEWFEYRSAEAVTTVYTRLSVPSIISSDMVLQRDLNCPIWGTAAPDEAIEVTFAGQTLTARADALGRWAVMLAPMPANKIPQTMTIESESGTIELKNILVGEVWLCSGQSNMQYSVRRYKGFAAPKHGKDMGMEELKKAPNPMIRVFLSDRAHSWNAWQVASSSSLPDITAAGYFFGKDIQKELDVPVGIISAALGGQRIETWTTVEAYKRNEKFTRTLLRTSKIKGLTPGQWYNHLIAPLCPFAVKGFLWYQGENNCIIGERDYAEKFKVMVDSWREAFCVPDAPFYSVLLAPHKYSRRKNDKGEAVSKNELPLFREQQLQGVELVRNNGIICISDLVDNPQDIHPSYKWIVGERLARLALSKTYGKPMDVDNGPRLVCAERVRKGIRLTFNNTGKGLKSRDGKPLDWFETAGPDGVFHPATATITGTATVLVSSPEVKEPVSVRFGWDEVSMPDLMNSEGLPAFPFGAIKAASDKKK